MRVISLLSHKPGIYTSECFEEKHQNSSSSNAHFISLTSFRVFKCSSVIHKSAALKKQPQICFATEKKSLLSSYFIHLLWHVFLLCLESLAQIQNKTLKKRSLGCLPSKYNNSIILHSKSFLNPRIIKTCANFHLESMHVVHSHIKNIFGYIAVILKR